MRASVPSSGMMAICPARRPWEGSVIIRHRTTVTLRRGASAGLAVLLLAAACGGGAGGSKDAQPTARRTPSGPCTIARADIDGDGAVSIFDLTKVAAHFGEAVPPAPKELDQDGDGAITILDLNLVAGVFVKQVSDCP